MKVLSPKIYFRSILLCGSAVTCIGYFNFTLVMGQKITPAMLVLPFVVGALFGGLIQHIQVLRNQSLRAEKELAATLKTSDKLLKSILPESILERAKSGETPIIDRAEGIHILFIDLVGFTKMADQTEVTQVAESLNNIFRSFEGICHRYGVRKLKTVGDAFIMIHGIDPATRDNPTRLAAAALEVLKTSHTLKLPDGSNPRLRMGLHVGTVVMGVLGVDVPTFDIWGDAMNTASRLESTGQPNVISCSREARDLLKLDFELVLTGTCKMKGKGDEVEVWSLLRERVA